MLLWRIFSEPMHKLEHQSGENWVRHRHARTYEVSGSEGAKPRLRIGVDEDAPEIMTALARSLTGPYFVLYVLHTTRGEGELGRYQSEELDEESLTKFAAAYSDYLRSDGRFDLWVYSPGDEATIVWDRHNYLHAYGPIDRYATVLKGFSYAPGKVDPVLERPHMHLYRASNDPAANAILEALDWVWSPLRPADEQ